MGAQAGGSGIRTFSSSSASFNTSNSFVLGCAMCSARVTFFLISLFVHVASAGRMWGEGTEKSPKVEDPETTDTGLDAIDWDKMRGMKKSQIWAFVEERENTLKEAEAELRSRNRKHKKESAAVHRDWTAVKAKFDGLHAAQNADKKEIQGLEADAKAQKNEIRKLKSVVYKMR